MTEARGGGPAVQATQRALLLAVAVSILASAAAAVLVVSTVNDATAPGWWSALMVLSFGALLVGGSVSPLLGPRAGRRVAGAAAGVFAVTVLAYPPAALTEVHAGEGGTVPWLLTAVSAPALAVLVAGGGRWVAALLSLWLVVVVFSRVLLGGYSLTGLANDTQALLSAVTTCAVAAAALRAAADLDRSAERSAAAAVIEEGERARLSARSRAAAFVHDEVLAALRGVAEARPETEAAVLQQAARATATVSDRPRSADLVDRLGGLAAASGATLRVRRAPDAASCPPEVADAVAAATAQALENTRRHALGARSRIRVDLQPAGGEVEIVDDGPGFCPERVASDRLGIAVTILGVPGRIPGVEAAVVSAPGEGTRVRLRWSIPEPDAERRGVGGLSLRMRERLVGSLFVVTQTAVAIVATVQGGLDGPGAVSPAMLVVLLGMAALVGRTRGGITRPRALATVAALCGFVALGLTGVPAPVSYGSAWFVTAAAFVLVSLALRGRGDVALVGAGILLSFVVVDAIGRRADLPQMLGIGTRVATVVCLSVVFVSMLKRLRRSAAIQAEHRIVSARRAAWDAASHAELLAHLAEVESFARPLLERVGAAGRVTDDDRAEARAVEGRLRDGYRAGRLRGHGIADAAMRARLRGVDVVLLDDGGTTAPSEQWLPALADLVADRLAAAQRRIVVRVLPPGRADLAHIVTDGRLTVYPAAVSSAGAASIGVQGE